MAKAKLPSKIIIQDELGQEWHVDKDDDLWEDVRTLTNDGTQEAVLPLSVIHSKRGWGWWSLFQSQEDWTAATEIPKPDHHLLDELSDARAQDLAPMLQRFGAYVAFLEAQVGALAGRRNALKQAYDAAVMVHMADPDLEDGTLKEKEAQILSESESIRQTKRLFIETDMLYDTAVGMCKAYQKAWETTSRIVSIRLAEMDIGPRRIS